MVMAVWAFLDLNNLAVNFIESDGIPERIPDGCTAVKVPDQISYGFGWLWDGKKFIDTNPSLPTVPGSITRRQCARQLLASGMITGDEAISMTQTGTPPAAIQAYLDTLPGPDKTIATIDFAADNYYRDNPLLSALMVANGMTNQQVDEFFIAASQL